MWGSSDEFWAAYWMQKRKHETSSSNFSLDGFFKVVGAIVALGSLMFTAITYFKGQQWESAKFVTQKLESFSDDKNVQKAEFLLDYAEGIFYTDKDSFYYSQDLLQVALSVDSPHIYSHDQLLLRNIFDNYFSKLSTFNNYYKMNSANRVYISTYLKYYISIIGDTANKMKDNDTRMILWAFIDHYGYQDVQELSASYGYDIVPTQQGIKKKKCLCCCNMN